MDMNNKYSEMAEEHWEIEVDKLSIRIQMTSFNFKHKKRKKSKKFLTNVNLKDNYLNIFCKFISISFIHF